MSDSTHPALPLQENVPVEITLAFVKEANGVVDIKISSSGTDDISDMALLLSFTLEKIVMQINTPNDTPTQ